MNAPDKKKLGLMSIILLGINSMIGSGIFLLPGQITSLVGSWSLFVYLFVASVALAIAWCFAKCSALFSRNGGPYLYARHAFGNFIGFEIGMMRWAVGIIAWASLAVGFITAIGTLWPAAQERDVRNILILSLIGGLGVLNVLDFRMMTIFNNIITIAKLIPLFFFVGVGVFYIQKSNFISVPFPELDSHSFGATALIIFYAFGGFESLVVAAGEMENPKKNVPIAVMSTITICGLLYFFIQLVAIGTLGSQLAVSTVPMSDVAELVLGSTGKLVITVAMLISIGGVNIASSFLTPRYGSALAEDGMIPEIIARKNRYGAPFIAILLTVFATSMIAMSGSFTQLVAISAVSRFAQHISTCLATLVFYKNRLTFSIVLAPVVAIGAIFWLMWQAPLYQLASGFAALILSVPLYFMGQRRREVELVKLEASV
jgi:amino acid transporter